MNALNSVFKVIIAPETTTCTTTSHSQQPGVDFFRNSDYQSEDNHSAINSVLSRAKLDTTSRFDPIHCGTSHRGWGIND